uniref:39S ribosomal protein L18, mitochondrial n=1 Tax=Heterorhabditis bacteriophora TaxID=37862 RepID=A0A1I7WJ08_HETBA
MSVRLATRFLNRNPRNMEQLGRQIPPSGYQFEKDCALRSYIYNNTDTCAAMNLGRVLAIRCLKSGILFAVRGIQDEHLNRSIHVRFQQQEFFKTLSAEGISLVEPVPLEHSYGNDKRMTWERYPLKATREDKLDEL